MALAISVCIAAGVLSVAFGGGEAMALARVWRGVIILLPSFGAGVAIEILIEAVVERGDHPVRQHQLSRSA